MIAAFVATSVHWMAIGEDAPNDGITPAHAIAAMTPVISATRR